MDAGDYVPDSLTNELVTDRLSEADAHGGFLLDGYPRTTDQVRYLDELLASHGHTLDAVIRLIADQEEIVRRLTRRAEQEGRTDDSEEAIRHRQEVYQRETAPLLEMFGERGLLIEIDGLGPVDEVSERVATPPWPSAASSRAASPPRPDVVRLGRSIYKSPSQLREMLAPGLLTAASLDAVRAAIRPGVTTLELDAIAERTIRDGGGVPNFMKEPGYHHTLCVSVNDEVVHGVPGARVLAAGDLVSVDSGAEVGGWNGDSAFSMVVPGGDAASAAARQALADAADHALWAGIAALASVRHLNDIGGAIEDAVGSRGQYGILEEYVGHGIGRSMHEEPPVFNYRVRSAGPAVKPGLVVAIEPMLTASGSIATHVLSDGWTVATDDGSDAAHVEHSVAVHAGGIWVLTAADGGAAGLAPFGVAPVPIG